VKEVIIGVAAIVLLAFVLYQKPNVVNPMGSDIDMTHSHGAHSASQSNPNVKSTAQNNTAIHTADQNNMREKVKSLTGNAHYDQMSPEVKEALKNSLLLENPVEEIIRPDGITEIRSNGRFSQMPVAVQMPDGTIQIREYSEVPK